MASRILIHNLNKTLFKFAVCLSVRILVSVLAIVACQSVSFAKNILTEVRVELFLRGFVSAHQQQNMDLLLSHFSPDANIRLEFPPLMGDKKMSMSLSEYKAYLENEMSPNQKKEYSVSKLQINVDKAGLMANVSNLATETAKLSGQFVKIRSNHWMDIELVDGKPRITRFHSVVKHVQLPEKLKMLLSVLNPETTKIEYLPSDVVKKYGYEPISKTAKDEFADGDSFDPTISADGRFIAFSSTANNLVDDDNNNESDIFLYDTVTKSLKLVSHTADKKPANGSSMTPSISGDGLTVAFVSLASNLTKNDTNGFADVFLYDVNTGKIERVSQTISGKGGNDSSDGPNVSFDGKTIVFRTMADNLVKEDNNDSSDIFLFSQNDKSIIRVSIPQQGGEANDNSKNPKISANGQFVVFESDASNLVYNDNNARRDVFYYDIEHKTLNRISVNSKQQELDGDSWSPVISESGQYVLFQSEASNAVKDTKSISSRIYLRDTGKGKTRLVSSEDAREPKSVSSDGRFLIYSIWVEDKLDTRTSTVIHDLYQDKMTEISRRYKRQDNTQYSYAMSIDGRFVAFVTDSSMAKSKDHYKDVQLFLTSNPFKP